MLHIVKMFKYSLISEKIFQWQHLNIQLTQQTVSDWITGLKNVHEIELYKANTNSLSLSHLLWKLGLVGMFLVCDSVAFSRGRQRLECFLTCALYAVNLTDGLIINQGISPLFWRLGNYNDFQLDCRNLGNLLAILRGLDNMYCM